MSAQAIREETLRMINNLDESALKIVHDQLKAGQEIVGYRANGTPMTLIDLERRLEKSEEQYKNGQYTDVKDLIKKHQ